MNSQKDDSLQFFLVMNKDIKYFGLDFSRDVFDVCDNMGHYQFKNSTLLKRTIKNNWLYKQIPQIGNNTALMLSVFIDGFKRFKRAEEMWSYSGLTHIIRQSGSSTNGRSKISKIGHIKLTNLPCMCSFNACKYNKGCKALYDWIVAKGKRKKLALIAVCSKLLKQAFAVVKKGLPYDEKYKSKLEKN